jgi:hypothetical protein
MSGCPSFLRLARMDIPGLPHDVTQRGNRREAIFFEMEISRFIATCLLEC